jgi:hypothetical protein
MAGDPPGFILDRGDDFYQKSAEYGSEFEIAFALQGLDRLVYPAGMLDVYDPAAGIL